MTTKAETEDCLNRYYKALAKMAQDFIFVVDARGNVKYVNSYSAKLFNIPPKILLNKSIKELFPGKAASRMLANINKAVKSGKPANFADLVSYPEYSLHLETRLMPFRDPSKKFNAVLGISRNITAGKLTETLYKQIVNHSDDAIILIDRNLRFVMANTQFLYFCKKMGFTKSFSVGDKISNFKRIFTAKITNHYKKVFKTGSPNNSKETAKLDDGSILMYTAKRIPIFSVSKQPQFTMGIFRNVTKEQLTMEKLRKSDKFSNNVFDSIQDGISVLDKDLNILRANKIMKNWHKHALPLEGKKCYEAYHQRKSACKTCPTLKTLQTGKACSDVIARTDANGKESGWVEISAYPLKNTLNGKIEGIIEHVKDISQTRKAEQQLIDSENKYRDLWNNAPVAYHTLNPDGIITNVNETELTMLGYHKKDMIGKPIFDFIEPSQREEARLRFLRKIAGKETLKSGNRTYIRSDETKIFVSVDDVLEYNDKHEVVAILTTMIDVTRQKQIENELKYSFTKLKKTMDDAMRVIARLVEMRDPYTAGHQLRVAELAHAIAHELRLDDDAIERIRIAGLLHDIGKINVPIEILSKPGKISESELNIIKIHPSIGYEILKEMDLPYPIAETVLQHHERLNGKGYPYGLSSKNILFEARILMVSDVVEAMSSHRPYRPSKGLKLAFREIRSNRGTLYDTKVANACLNVFKNKHFKFSVR